MAKKRALTKKAGSNEDIKTTAELRRTLLDTIRGVRAGDIDHKQGNTVSALARTVVASAKLDLEVLRFHRTLESEGSATTLKAIELK